MDTGPGQSDCPAVAEAGCGISSASGRKTCADPLPGRAASYILVFIVQNNFSEQRKNMNSRRIA
jgi:hypothetical protein